MERRKKALLILNEYETKQTYLNLALKQGLAGLAEGAGFVTEVVYGVVRYRRFLDEKISRYSNVKLKKISIPVKNIVRIAFYQIYFMEKIPAFAILNESGKLAEKFAYKSKGFINAILRKGVEKTEETMPVAVRESFPDELYEKIFSQYGDQAETILRNLNQKPPVSLRYNHLRFKDVSDAAQNLEEPQTDGDVIFPGEKGSPLKLIENGDFSVQSASSQLAVQILDPKPGERVLDCCSAPGGKTAYIGEKMQNQGELIACELHPHRAELVKKNLERCGVTIGTVFSLDATKANFEQPFDRILADVPCSGLGVIGSKPDIKWREFLWKELCQVQADILRCMKNHLKEDGILVYSTCTINQEENEQQIAQFLQENPEFLLEPFSVNYGGKVYGEKGMAQIVPDGTTIGFFVAKLRKGKK